ncbi:MAG: MerR family transcriptional regulator [Clostridia bacterium]|nr:MerR family transcriptional regulator [Clostridia bacterium]
MKIKSVCELTGLTDRTIRYYIEEKLISPLYTENYLGRKTYNFSDRDIKDLNDIAVLRKFDFTLDEIKSVINDAETSKEILSNVKDRTAQTVLDNQNKLSVLSQISTEKVYTVAELAEELSKASLDLPEHKENIKTNNLKTALSVLKTIIIIAVVWLPIVLSLFVVIISINDYHYPVFEPVAILLTIASFLPSIAVLIVSKTKLKWKKIARRILLGFCVLSIPISFFMSFGIVSRSETTDFRNYRDFDADCLANRNVVFQELFPNWPHYFENVKQADGSYKTVYLDSNYYYHYYQGFDYTYDIYAEWPLSEDEYTKEVKRATAVFVKNIENKTYNYKFAKLIKGKYHCLVLYSGDEPFTKATDNYDYIIFAYNDENNTVRYIYCDSLENGADQPYYLELDW